MSPPTLEPQIEFSGLETDLDSRVRKRRQIALKSYYKHRNMNNPKRNKVRREESAWHCICGLDFFGTGNWKKARSHSEWTGHSVFQGIKSGV
jgi:hypothetical protein